MTFEKDNFNVQVQYGKQRVLNHCLIVCRLFLILIILISVGYAQEKTLWFSHGVSSFSRTRVVGNNPAVDLKDHQIVIESYSSDRSAVEAHVTLTRQKLIVGITSYNAYVHSNFQFPVNRYVGLNIAKQLPVGDNHTFIAGLHADFGKNWEWKLTHPNTALDPFVLDESKKLSSDFHLGVKLRSLKGEIGMAVNNLLSRTAGRISEFGYGNEIPFSDYLIIWPRSFQLNTSYFHISANNKFSFIPTFRYFNVQNYHLMTVGYTVNYGCFVYGLASFYNNAGDSSFESYPVSLFGLNFRDFMIMFYAPWSWFPFYRTEVQKIQSTDINANITIRIPADAFKPKEKRSDRSNDYYYKRFAGF